MAIAATCSPALADADTGSAGTGSASSGSSSGSGQIMLPIPSERGLAALGWAMTQIGKRYEWGGSGPDGWDCSGLVQWSFHQAGVALPRTSWQQATVGAPVPFLAMSPGDIVVLNRDGSHVAIYAGFGQIFNAYDQGVPVGFSPLRHFRIYAIRRL